MNIQFTIMAHGLMKAAAIEKALKDIGAPYEAKEAKPVATNGGRRRTRMIITKKEIMAVEQCFAANPGFMTSDVSNATGVSKASVGRIKLGQHALQQGGSDIEKDI
jgi:hypothetical protein